MNVREISQVFQDGFPNELIAWGDLLLKMRDSTFVLNTTVILHPSLNQFLEGVHEERV